MHLNEDWFSELKELRDAVHELDGRISEILGNLNNKCSVNTATEVNAAQEFDELGEY